MTTTTTTRSSLTPPDMPRNPLYDPVSGRFNARRLQREVFVRGWTSEEFAAECPCSLDLGVQGARRAAGPQPHRASDLRDAPQARASSVVARVTCGHPVRPSDHAPAAAIAANTSSSLAE